MANWSTLKAAVAQIIKTNNNQEITGANMRSVLNNIIDNVGENATYAGIATPSTNPGAPDGNVFYFATQAGTYTNFGGAELEAGLNILLWNGSSWNATKVMTIAQELGYSKNAVVSQDIVTNNIDLKNAYFYQVISADGVNIPSLDNGILTIPAQSIITERNAHVAINETVLNLSEILGDSYNYATIILNKDLATITAIPSSGSLLVQTKNQYFLGMAGKNKSYLYLNSKYWKMNGSLFTNNFNLTDYENTLSGIDIDIRKIPQMKYAYFYRVDSENSDILPSLDNGVLTIPSQYILTQFSGHYVVEEAVLTINSYVDDYNYAAIIFDSSNKTISLVSMANNSFVPTTTQYFLGIVQKNGGFMWVNSKYWKVNGVVYSNEVSETRLQNIELRTKFINFQSPSYNVSDAILELEFYGPYRDITLQRFNYENNDRIIKFYEWNSNKDYTVIEFNPNSANKNGDVYTWDLSIGYLKVDFSKTSKTFGVGTILNNQVVGTAFISRNVFGFKQARLYSVISSSDSTIPSFNTSTKILTIPSQNILAEGKPHRQLSETVINVAETLPEDYNFGYLFYSYDKNTISVIRADASNYNSGDTYFLGIVSKSTQYFLINSKYWKVNGVVYSSEISETRLQNIESQLEREITLTDEERKIIMGKNLYFIDGELLPLYKSSLVVSNKVNKLCLMQKIQEWTRFSVIDFNFPKYHYFEDVLYFDSTSSTDEISIAEINGTEDVMFAVRGIKVNHVTKESLNGKTAKYLPYGASNTGFGWGRIVAEYLKQFNCTIETVGVLKQGGNMSGTSNPCYGEGRGGWGYLTYIGKKPYNQGNWITYPPASQGKNTFTNTMNPFMREATDDDKQNHAEYCFPDYTHAGQDGAGTYEVWSLQEIRNKGFTESNYGTFYIYDFEWYLQNRPVETPDVITIQLGLNDSPAITASQFALPWILDSITNAAPNCKIGICPSPAVIQTAYGDNYTNNYSSYNNWLNSYLEEYGNNNVTVLNLAASMNRQLDFAFNSVNGTKVSDDGNLTEKVEVSNNDTYGGSIHSDNDGLMEIGRCIGAFVANVIQ